MSELIIVYDDSGNWKQGLHDRVPHYFDLKVKFGDREYTIQGLDERIFDTEEKALQEAVFKLKLERRPRSGGAKYNVEQAKALDEYQCCRNHLQDAIILIDNLKLLTAEEVGFESLKDKTRAARQKCKQLGCDII